MDDAEILLANIYSIGEHATWQNCIDQVESGLYSWLRTEDDVNFRRVYIVGCGTSYYAAQVGKYLIEHLTHLPVEAHQAFAFSIYTDPALLNEKTLVIGVSTTGNTESVCNALEFAHHCGAITLAFTATAGSKITEISHTTILTGGKVTVAVKTETYLQSLICLYLFGIHLAEALGLLSSGEVADWQHQIHKAEESTQRFFARQQPEIAKLVDLYGSADMVFVVGTGPNFGTAEEASLKVVEIAKMYSVSKEMEEFFHGYDRELNGSSPMFFLAPGKPALDRMLDFLTFNRKIGVPSIVLTNEQNLDVKRVADHVILLEDQLYELATPLIYIAPFYLFSYHMAVKRGFDPSARRFPGIMALKIRYRDEY
jgi:glucosamine--fructose-6-phosphate aminotransferase (isomerizing)